MTDKKNKTKNPCKVCNKTVTDKTGRRCEGVCRKWIHYNCLDYTPDKIDDIKKGIIKINCPCPNCENDNIRKEQLSNQKNPGTISGNCGKANCPAIAKVDSELKCSSIPTPRKPYQDAGTTIEDYSVLVPSENKSVGTNSSLEKLVLRVSRAESPPREHRRTSPMRGHQATCVAPYEILFETTLLNPPVNVTTSPATYPCSDSCKSLCSRTRSDDQPSTCASKDQGTNVKTDPHNKPDPKIDDIKCPYCKTRIILGGVPKRLYEHIQQQKQNNFVVECSDSECEVSPCFEYKSNKNQDEPTMTQKMIAQCLKRSTNAIPSDSSVTSVATSLSPKLEPSNGKTADIMSETCEIENPVQNALTKLLTRLYDNIEDIQKQFKILMHYINCPTLIRN